MYAFFNWLQRAYQKFHLSYILPFIILISYTLLGAAIFRSLELERDLNERESFRASYYYAFAQITQRILELRCEDEIIKRDSTLQLRYAEEAVIWFLDYMNFTHVIIERNASSPWSWYGSMFYAGQLYTTIGYGLPVAKTLAGQIASIFYIMFGIPIFLIILKDVGRLLSRSFRKFYKRMRITRRKSSESLKRMKMSIKAFYNRAYLPSDSLCAMPRNESLDMNRSDNTLIKNKKKLAHENAFPIPIALAMLILWIGLSAALFCLYEREWGYLTSVYFFFVSISTVGLGDIVPGNKDMMLGYFLLILIGLALLSMCINLIQVALERILGQLLQEYIDEIERVAAIAKSEVDLQKDSPPFEVGIASGLLTIPLTKKHEAMQSFPRRIKNWLAERIANNMIESQLIEVDSDVESDTEILPTSEQQQVQGQQPARANSIGEIHSIKLAFRHGDLFDRLREHIPAIRAVQALEKAKFYIQNDDFQSVLFNKFLTNAKLGRYVNQVCELTRRVNHAATQTDFMPYQMLASVDQELHFSSVSKESSLFRFYPRRTHSVSESLDGSSGFLDTYYDVQFTSNTIADDTTSIDTFAAINHSPKISSAKKPSTVGCQRRPNQQQSTRRQRPKSYQGPMPICSNNCTKSVLPLPSPNFRLFKFSSI